MDIHQNLKIAEVVSNNIKYADIFKKHNIDFCCGGGISIAKACENKKISLDTLLDELKNLDNNILPSQNYNSWNLDFLIDYIINTHHAYILQSVQLLDAYTSKVSKVHGAHHPPVIEIERLYKIVIAELLPHLRKEEQILFPFIKQLVQSNKENTTPPNSPFGSIQNPIAMMQAEHDSAGDVFKEIALLSNNYTPPEWACNTFKALYAKLEEFEQDLHVHVHLENNILFPKAILLEDGLK